MGGDELYRTTLGRGAGKVGSGTADNVLVKDVGADREVMSVAEVTLGEPLELRLQSLTYEDRAEVLFALTEAIDLAGGWILEKRTISAHALELRIELQTRGLIEMYAALVGSAIELTRNAHLLLAERCTCLRHLRGRGHISAILAIRLEVAFVGDPSWQDGWIERMVREAAHA